MSGFFDVHCHLLPGVDDGVKDLEDAIKLLKEEYSDGVRTIFLTPHYRRGMFECSMERICQQYELLKQETKKFAPDLLLKLGCEFHANMDMIEILEAGARPTMANSSFVLTEFSNNVEKRFLVERCQSLLCNGYIPIIAHAERCLVIRKDMDLLKWLVETGVYIQINAESIMGDSGLIMKVFCRKIMQRNLLHFIGSDAHNGTDRRPNIKRCIKYVEKTMGKEYQQRIFISNPKQIIEGNE